MHRYFLLDEIISEGCASEYITLIDEMTRKEKKCSCAKHELQVILKMPQVAQELWPRVQAQLQQDLQCVSRHGRVYDLVGLADDVTLSRHYKPIGKHHDKPLTYGSRADNTELKCLYKMGIYLNNIVVNSEQEHCKCGKQHCNRSGSSSTYGGTVLYDEDGRVEARVVPKVGRALIFDIRDLHSGDKIPKGQIKYMIGFRLLYREQDRQQQTSPEKCCTCHKCRSRSNDKYDSRSSTDDSQRDS